MLSIGMAGAASAWAPVPSPRSVSGQFAYFVEHPAAIFEIAIATMRASCMFNLQSFVGILGWLNVHLTPRYCVAAGCAGALAAIWSACTPANVGAHSNVNRACLIVSVLVSVGMNFGALYLTWTVVQAPIVDGVQGRYFVHARASDRTRYCSGDTDWMIGSGGGTITSRLLAAALLGVLLPAYTYVQASSSLANYYYVR
ncbi:DUF2142 domain-containing protein [Burkholderia territorii]|uniref:DUF2142 domain-containing protein n=1 Tax=Burkholderia territorii TaxID=1503055 RepID=UPI0018C710E3|nr:DUF2142 domain-containing protein [Burkholderia territorii]